MRRRCGNSVVLGVLLGTLVLAGSTAFGQDPPGQGHRQGMRHARSQPAEDGPRSRPDPSGRRRPKWGGRWFATGQEGPDRPPREEFLLNERERKELLAFVKEHFPDVYEHLERYRQVDDGTYARAVHRLAWPMLKLQRLSKRDPELAAVLIGEHKVEMALADLKRDYLDFPSVSAREKIKSDMHLLLEQRFDLRQKRLALEIQDLEQRLIQAKKRLDDQETNKAVLVDAELERWLDFLEDEHEWRKGSEPPGPPRPPVDGPGPLSP